MFKIEVAIWHPMLSSDDIESAVGFAAKKKFSTGTPRAQGSGMHKETYCRFDFGIKNHPIRIADIEMLDKMRPLLSSNHFYVNGAASIVYFIISNDSNDLYIESKSIKYLNEMGFGIVFRIANLDEI